MKRIRKFKTVVTNIFDLYKDRKGYRIVFGTREDNIFGKITTLDIDIPIRLGKRLKISDHEVFSIPLDCENSSPDWISHLVDLELILGKGGILSKSKIARRWFMKRIKDFVFGSNRLSYYLKPGTNELDWKKVYKEEN